jgi:hypothetical protein
MAWGAGPACCAGLVLHPVRTVAITMELTANLSFLSTMKASNVCEPVSAQAFSGSELVPACWVEIDYISLAAARKTTITQPFHFTSSVTNDIWM